MLDNNPFRYEVMEVANKGSVITAAFMEAVISTTNGTFNAINVVGMNRYRDYIENFTQQLH